jgi:hypothetical protein
VWFETDNNKHERDFYEQSVIFTRRIWFIHAEGGLHTHESDYDKHECDFYAQSVIFTRKLGLRPAQVWFLHPRCDLYMQSVIVTCRDTHNCIYVLTLVRLILAWYM